MSCPFLRRTQPARCIAVAGEPGTPTRGVVAALCKGAHQNCPAFRFVHSAGRLADPCDFRAWVLRGTMPGRLEPDPEPAPEPQ